MNLYFPLALGNTWIYVKTIHVSPDVPHEIPTTTILYDTLILESEYTINELRYFKTNLDEYYRTDQDRLYKGKFHQGTFYEYRWVDFSRPVGHIDHSWTLKIFLIANLKKSVSAFSGTNTYTWSIQKIVVST